MSNNARRMRVDFREADLLAVLGNVHAGKSTEIVGLGSVGKSNFVRRLQFHDVLDRYLYQYYNEQAHCLFILLDANCLLESLPSALYSQEPSGWAGYELIASRLMRAVMDTGIMTHVQQNDPAHPDALYRLYHRMWPGENPHVYAHLVVYRYLEDLISRIFIAANRALRLIFVFDEFERFLAQLPTSFFHNLRGLRDQYKDRVLFITTVRQISPLLVPVDRYLEYEPFIELFNDARHFLLPYRPSDADQTFERLASRQDYQAPPAHLREQLLTITYGHAGLLRAAFTAWMPLQLLRPGMSDEDVIHTLLRVQAVVDECKTIWSSLSDAERQILFDMARNHQHNQPSTFSPLNNPMVRLLVRKGILLDDQKVGFGHIRPHLLASFIYSISYSEPGRQTGNTPPPQFPPATPFD